jgi:hypothetical protein
MGAQYQSLLFYCNSYWLSREIVVVHVYSLREAVALSLDDENLVHAEYFAMNVWFLCQHTRMIFLRSSVRNSMQGNDTPL